MKNAIIFHGSGGTPEIYWYPWLKIELEKIGYKIWVPQLPEARDPDLSVQLPFVKTFKILFAKELAVISISFDFI